MYRGWVRAKHTRHAGAAPGDAWCQVGARLYESVPEALQDLEEFGELNDPPMVTAADQIPDGACAVCALLLKQKGR